MTHNIYNGNCLDEMKQLADKSIDLMICDLPYGETNCKWDIKIDMAEFWVQFKRVRKHDRVACIHFCSTKFGYQLIKSWEAGFKMDMVWKKRNKTGGLVSRNRPMRNHEMVYFFYDKCPKYNRDTYHKRISKMPKVVPDVKGLVGVSYGIGNDPKFIGKCFEPLLPASIINEKDVYGNISNKKVKDMESNGKARYTPLLPVSVVNEVEDHTVYNKNTVGWSSSENNKTYLKLNPGYTPRQPGSVVEEDDELIEPAEDEPKSMYESGKVFIGKRHHQTEKPIDILEFFVKYWTDEGDTILDPTMGSGSTAVAAIGLKRNFIGYELDPKIFKVAEERIKKGK